MARQIIKQPNGKYCIYDSIINNITDYDMSIDDLIKNEVSIFEEEITEKIKNIVNKIENNERPYYQFTKTYEDALSTIKNIHGINEYNCVKNIIENK